MDKLTEITAWAGAYRGKSFIHYPKDENQCFDIIKKARKNNFSINPTGARVSFGDMVVNNDMITIDTKNMNKILKWDKLEKTLIVESGVKISAILKVILIEGWILSSIPGSLSATIGGCVANNVHGKDSLKAGNFGRHVKWIDLMISDGTIIRLSKKDNYELFRATIGGLGLTGIIIRVALIIFKIPSINIISQNYTCKNIHEVYQNIILENKSDYLQSWLDPSSKNDSLGRGIIMKAVFENKEKFVSTDKLLSSLDEKNKIFGIIPSYFFWSIVRPFFHYPFMKIINDLYFHKSKLKIKQYKKIVFSKYFFFHNNIPNFYSLYNPPGFIEIQALLPKSLGSKSFENILKTSQKKNYFPVLSGMKKTIKDDFLISFQDDGASISLDIPLINNNLNDLKKSTYPIYSRIADFGGKVNLSKDLIMPKEFFKIYYPEWDKFWHIKCQVDRNNMFSNDMARRFF